MMLVSPWNESFSFRGDIKLIFSVGDYVQYLQWLVRLIVHLVINFFVQWYMLGKGKQVCWITHLLQHMMSQLGSQWSQYSYNIATTTPASHSARSFLISFKNTRVYKVFLKLYTLIWFVNRNELLLLLRRNNMFVKKKGNYLYWRHMVILIFFSFREMFF